MPKHKHALVVCSRYRREKKWRFAATRGINIFATLQMCSFDRDRDDHFQKMFTQLDLVEKSLLFEGSSENQNQFFIKIVFLLCDYFSFWTYLLLHIKVYKCNFQSAKTQSDCVVSPAGLTWNHLACRSEASAAWHFCLSRTSSSCSSFSSSSGLSLLSSRSPSSGERTGWDRTDWGVTTLTSSSHSQTHRQQGWTANY